MTTPTYTRAKDWNGEDLKGLWEATVKIDGVRAFWTADGWVSRNGKPLYNLPPFPDTVPAPSEGFEAYRWVKGRSSKENFYATNGDLKAKNKPERVLSHQDLFSLEPIDRRLMLPPMMDPQREDIRTLLRDVLADGAEGLVLRQAGVWIKVKPEETYDVTVIGVIPGKGKHKGRMGALVTSKGNVGTGFTDEERVEWWDWLVNNNAGDRKVRIIEVSCMGLTKDGKFRHPRFERLRDDKDETDDTPT